ncbi:MAG: ABC transporter permease subunit [Desertifilum sp.]|nr:ABC transporter permease subunit [Desertifilum sp.]
MTRETPQKVPLLRDERFWRIAIQVIVLAIVGAIALILIANLNQNLRQQGTVFGFNFLRNPAGFSIGDTPIPYRTNDPYLRALAVGLVNSLRVIGVGFIFTTILGVVAGIASFSENWLLRKLSLVYVELVRNIPLLLQLFFWYFAVFFQLPPVQDKLNVGGFLFLSKRGIALPWPTNIPATWLSVAALGAIAIAVFFLWQWRTHMMVEQGTSGQPQLIALAALGVTALFILSFGLSWQVPQDTGTTIRGGLQLSIEFAAILAGLVVYTSAFIAEIVRAGIQAVPKGQWEAARSLGLKSGLVMRLVVFPQALRVIIPGLNSQYMNLAKNSSLAIAIGYPDIYSVANTTYNQTGRPVEVFLLIMAAYLVINLIVSLLMNKLNQAVQLTER